MHKKFYLIFLSYFIASSHLVCASTIQFPLDEPVIQSSQIYFHSGTGDKYSTIYEFMHTFLNIKKINRYGADIESSYLDMKYEYDYQNELWGGGTKVRFNSKNPETTDQEYLMSWQQIVDQPQLITVTSDYVRSSENMNKFLTFRANFLCQNTLNVLPYLHDMNLNVGDSFNVKGNAQGLHFAYDGLQFIYTIIEITDDEVHYKVKVAGALYGAGEGFWKRENGLLGRVEFCLFSNVTCWKCIFKSRHL
jgi:hypothetical protein